MSTIFEGERWDIASGSTKIHYGTIDYLTKIGASLREDKCREVPEAHVDQEGKYIGPIAAE